MTETLVERRRRLLRDEIGMIAVELFASRGFDAVTVDDIAEAAGTSPRTVFRYFASKDEIVLYLARRLDARLIAVASSLGWLHAPKGCHSTCARCCTPSRMRVS